MNDGVGARDGQGDDDEGEDDGAKAGHTRREALSKGALIPYMDKKIINPTWAQHL